MNTKLLAYYGLDDLALIKTIKEMLRPYENDEVDLTTVFYKLFVGSQPSHIDPTLLLYHSVFEFQMSSDQRRAKLILVLEKRLEEHKQAIQSIGIGYPSARVEVGQKFLRWTKIYYPEYHKPITKKQSKI